MDRKKLHYRCWHRSTREMDLILGRWFDQTHLTKQELKTLEDLLEENDAQLYLWISGQAPLPSSSPQRRLLKRIAQNYDF